MIVELKLNKELMELIKLIAQRKNVSIPQFIQDTLESAAIEDTLIYSLDPR